MEAIAVDVYVLNYNGRALLDACLPSIVRSAAESRHACRVVVLDNGSTDDSTAFVAERFPSVTVESHPNRGLCSFNEALRRSSARVALLLNNDVKSEVGAFDPLIEPLLDDAAAGEPVAFTAPRCYLFDGATHEGFKTAVQWRLGLVQATSHFAGATDVADVPSETASAGAVLAVDRRAFLELGGFDAVYLPGRIEDLDFCYRAFAGGYRGAYVPQSVFLHRGGATFDSVFGRRGCDRLALRNTLLFQWRNLRHPRYWLHQFIWLPVRAVRDVASAPFVAPDHRFAFLRAAREAWQLHRRSPRELTDCDVRREREFFTRHSPSLLAVAANREVEAERTFRENERRRDVNYPISRWYLRPAACALAVRLAALGVRPTWITLLGLFIAMLAAACLIASPTASALAAGLILLTWFCDRLDGPLARFRGEADAWGAWLDANVDECVDLGLHVAAAAAASQLSGSSQPWFWLIGFLVGKYLLMHGMASDDDLVPVETNDRTRGELVKRSLTARLYHLPANADVRIHLLVAAVACGSITAELAFVAVYYNLRWMARYVLLARRLRTAVVTGAAS